MSRIMKFCLFPFVASWLAVAAPSQPAAQQPLIVDHQQHSLSTQRSRLIKQNASICDAGSDHWTGSVPVGDHRDMPTPSLTCRKGYFESRADPETAPLIIWLNGGPGASSLLGAFHELVGPCTVNDDGQGTTRNELSWTNFANVLFIDQPVGVGFSATEDSDLWAASLTEGGVDFDHFLETFLTEFFPQLQDREVHLAGESFGGRYCPVYASMTKRKLTSVMLFNALVDERWRSLGAYRHLCRSKTISNPLNGTACAEMEAAYPACYKFGQLCSATYDADICSEASKNCAAVWEPFYQQVVPGGRNPYDDRTKCTTPPMCGHLGKPASRKPRMEQVEKYMNSENLQRALGFERAVNYSVVNMDLNTEWATHPDMVIPSTRELSNILDDKATPILVVNGNNDVIV
ncbi:Alpha/Beta hydrolase protein [Fusarium solani]|uniref:carboxypeptidase C n=1 Tax=Fusarium solani TaxID=169388 RepID=A0A9P9K4C8_FUSSL|nr:Alpha/Beta hydrolase protein [Fusarium solani]KAH7239774.1 Alpha/Beta hydrolase protein [Fusarium solani]